MRKLDFGGEAMKRWLMGFVILISLFIPITASASGKFYTEATTPSESTTPTSAESESTTTTTTAPSGQPSATVKVSASKTSVKQGENVTLTYEITNAGNVNLSYVELSEPSLGKIASTENLGPRGKEGLYLYHQKHRSKF
jgi:hypothetical protein